MNKAKIGQRVIVYDRYRFAISVRGVVSGVSKNNDGVQVLLTTTNNPHFPVASEVWVSVKQLRKDKAKRSKQKC